MAQAGLGLMFGAPIGVSLGEEDIRDNQKFMLDAQHRLGQIAGQPGEMRKTAAEADKLELDNASRRRMVELLSRRASGVAEEGTDISDDFDSLAKDVLGIGDIKTARELAGTASTIRVRAAREEQAYSAAANSEVQRIGRLADLQGQILAAPSIVDQLTWEQANAAYYLQTGEVSPWATQPFSPELKERVRQTAMSVVERSRETEQQLNRKSREKAEEQRVKDRAASRALARKRNEIAETRAAQVRKAGGATPKSPGAPTRGEMDQAQRMLRQDFGGAEEMSTRDREDAAFAIVSHAKALRQRNPALDMNMALQQAYNDAKMAGDFRTEEAGLLAKRKTSFLGMGKTQQTPIQPKDAKELAKIPNGRYVMTPRGLGIKQADGIRLLSRDNTGGRAAPVDPEEDEDLEDDDGE